jgi:hypothetical protein
MRTLQWKKEEEKTTDDEEAKLYGKQDMNKNSLVQQNILGRLIMLHF